MKKIYLAFSILFLIACSKSEDSPNQDPQQNDEEQNDDDPNNDDDTPPTFEPYNLTLLADTDNDGDIVLMNIDAGSTTVVSENMTTASGLNVNDAMDFRETDRLTWFDINNDIDYTIFQKNLNNTNTYSYTQLCGIENEHIKFVTYGNGTIIIGSEYFNTTTSTLQSNFRAKGSDYDCVLTSYENYTTLSGTIVGNKLLCFVENLSNSSDKKLLKFNLSNATLEGEINFETLGSYTTDGEKLFVFSNGRFYKYDIATFAEELNISTNFYFTERLGFFETRFYEEKIFIHTGFPPPNLYGTGFTVLNRNNGEVILNIADTIFLPDLVENLHDAYQDIYNFTVTAINYNIKDEIIILSTYDGASGRNLLVYSNIDSEILEVIEIPYPAKKIYFRE